MRFKTFIGESVLYGKKLEATLKKYKNTNSYVIFSDDEKPHEKRLHMNIPMKGILAYPVKSILYKIKKEQILGITGWASSKYVIIVSPKDETKVFNVKKYGSTFKEDIIILKKWYLKNLPPTSKKTEERFDTFVYNAKNLHLNKFFTLLEIMKQMRTDIDVLLDDFFKIYKISALYFDNEDDAFLTHNKEIIFFNYKHMNIDAVEENI